MGNQKQELRICGQAGRPSPQGKRSKTRNKKRGRRQHCGKTGRKGDATFFGKGKWRLGIKRARRRISEKEKINDAENKGIQSQDR